MTRRARFTLFAGAGIALVVCLVVVKLLLAVLFGPWESSPKNTFERHFRTQVPDSVTGLQVSGFTALAGSNETLTFTIEERDLDTMLNRKGFVDVSAEVVAGKPTGIARQFWTENIEKAESLGISGSRFFQTPDSDDAVFYILIADGASGRVFYRYFKL